MLRSLRLVIGAMMSGVVVMGVVVALVLPGPRGAEPPLGWVAGVAAYGVAAALLAEAIGYRATASAVQVNDSTALGVFQSGTFLRAALGESVAFVALALAFVVEQGGLLLFLVGGLLALVSLAFHAYPWRRPIDKTEEALRRADLPLDLRERLGLDTGPVREL